MIRWEDVGIVDIFPHDPCMVIGYVITMAFIYNVEMLCSTCGIVFTFEWNLCGAKLNPMCNLGGTIVS
jgi:hypothetical protein